MKKILLSFFIVLLFAVTAKAQSWSKLGGSNGLDISLDGVALCTDYLGNVYAGAYNDSGEGPYVYKWNGTSWSILGGFAFDNEIMTLIADSSGNLYVGGEFTDSVGHSYVAKWDGTSWSQVGNAFNDYVFSIAFDKHGNLYAALGGVVMKFVGNTWIQLGDSSTALHLNSNINTMCIDTNDNVYVAGAFTDGTVVQDGKLSVNKWDGNSWTELGSGVCPQWDEQDNQIFSILADEQGNIYVGGILYDSAVDQSIQVYKWDGSSWSAIGNSTPGTYQYGGTVQLAFDKWGSLYAAGFFTDAGGYSYVAKWNGATWDEVGTGANALWANSWIQSISLDENGNIYAAGEFTDTTVTYEGWHPAYVAKYTNPAAGIVSVNNGPKASVYPNPAKDELNISVQSADITYTLLSITGVSLTSGSLHQGDNNISLNGFASGMYILEMRNLDGQMRAVQVVKN